MFDIGFWELTLLAVIGLIVLGPERLPVVARTLGLWVGRAKGYVSNMTQELERESRADEIREQIQRTREQIEADTRSAIEPARDALPREQSQLMTGAPPPDATSQDASHDADASDDPPAPADGVRQNDDENHGGHG